MATGRYRGYRGFYTYINMYMGYMGYRDTYIGYRGYRDTLRIWAIGQYLIQGYIIYWL